MAKNQDIKYASLKGTRKIKQKSRGWTRIRNREEKEKN